jgi:16S rRNA (guanine527-N7)-methyltransferase
VKPGYLIEIIRQLAGRGRFEPAEHVLKAVRAHAEVLTEWSGVFNLSGPASDELAAESLYFDSLVVGKHLSNTLSGCRRIDDVGSGAGFPGLFLPLFFPENTAFFLHEARRKKASFLRSAARSMGLGNVSVSNQRVTASSLSSNTVLSRAAFPPARWLELAATLVRPGGRVVLLRSGRGDDNTITIPKNLVHESAFDYTLPLSGRARAIVVYVNNPKR